MGISTEELHQQQRLDLTQRICHALQTAQDNTIGAFDPTNLFGIVVRHDDERCEYGSFLHKHLNRWHYEETLVVPVTSDRPLVQAIVQSRGVIPQPLIMRLSNDEYLVRGVNLGIPRLFFSHYPTQIELRNIQMYAKVLISGHPVRLLHNQNHQQGGIK